MNFILYHFKFYMDFWGGIGKEEAELRIDETPVHGKETSDNESENCDSDS